MYTYNNRIEISFKPNANINLTQEHFNDNCYRIKIGLFIFRFNIYFLFFPFIFPY